MTWKDEILMRELVRFPEASKPAPAAPQVAGPEESEEHVIMPLETWTAVTTANASLYREGCELKRRLRERTWFLVVAMVCNAIAWVVR